MAQQIYIDCGTAETAYQIVLTGVDISVFEAAAGNPLTKGKTGEDLAAAILDVAGEGITLLGRMKKDGRFNDGPKGEPAVFVFDYGRVKEIIRYKDGKKNDGAKGEIAHFQFGSDGRISCAARYHKGQRLGKLTDKEIAALQPKSVAVIKKEQSIKNISKANPAIKFK